MEKMISIPAARFAADEDAALKAKREELKKKLLAGKKVTIAPDGNVTKGDDTSSIVIPKGKLATEDAAAKKRKELAEKLKNSQPVKIAPNGNVTGNGGDSTITIPKGKLAGDDAIKRAREKAKQEILNRTRIKDALINGDSIVIDGTGHPTDDPNKAAIKIPAGKLAVAQWYEKDPGLLMAEKAAMNRAFPGFTLDKLDDGRLAWVGSLNIGILGDNEWHIMAVYNNNHPQQVMGSSVRVYLIQPDIDELIADLGWRPLHLLMDSNNQLYLCTAEAGNIKTGKETTSAASVIAWAVKWLMSFELVLTGDLTQEQFNTHGVL